MALLSSARALAGVTALTALAACYEPSVRDCVVSCTGADQCAADQICGADGWCAAPTVAGSCLDGGPSDAAPSDAASDADDDAVPMDAGDATLRLVISGRGKIVSDISGVDCAPNPGDCSFTVAAGTMVVVTAVETNPNFLFVDWSTPNCMGQGLACTFTVVAPLTLVGATFQ